MNFVKINGIEKEKILIYVKATLICMGIIFFVIAPIVGLFL